MNSWEEALAHEGQALQRAYLINKVLEHLPPSLPPREDTGPCRRGGSGSPRLFVPGAPLTRLPTSKQGGGSVSCSSAAQAVGLSQEAGKPAAVGSTPSVPHSPLSSGFIDSRDPGSVTTLEPRRSGQTAHCSDSSLTPSALHLSCTEPSGSSVTHFSKIEPSLLFFPLYVTRPVTAVPWRPAFLQSCSICPARDSRPVALAIILTAVCRAHVVGRQGTSHTSL